MNHPTMTSVPPHNQHKQALVCDAGPGMEVPGDPLSQGRDSVNVSGRAIPAVLHGNQYAVLYEVLVQS